MNINLKLTIPLKKDDGSEDELKVDSNLMLVPFYCSEEDVLSIFPSYKEEDLPVLRKIIFNSSLKADRLGSFLQKGIISDMELLSLKRDYTICLSNNEFAKRLNSSVAKARSQSKTLGDFTVTSSYTNDVSTLTQIYKDSTQCILELEGLIKSLEISGVLPNTFIKGRFNDSNIQANDRLWWLKDMGGFKVLDGFASKKFTFKGNQYKAGNLGGLVK